ncbi:hypothetical protein Salat_1286500 [Sesamum alatum]|uniref:NHL repeat-containing protein n=1 Tax=Sesamum alatum TaxID=300844 RepID=A0AAE2CPM5_9LAMI|nr:hypothetical protein Salat_1286500 [Sesamum alatum]
MASPIFYLSLLLLFHLSHLTPTHQAVVGGGELVYEDGYTVSTVLDGDKSNLKVNPHSVLHKSTPSDLFVLLDSAASTFYTVSLPTTSNKTEIQRLAGNGEHSYSDGDLALARFNKPRSFAVDFNGNIYVADHRNHAIRKITKSGVSTIAGGYLQKAGRTDGPGKDASFSDDFELTFIAQRCALMISDHGNRLVRQINLKEADCTRHSGSVLGTTSAWLLGLGLSCLLGLIVGFVIHPYVIPYEGFAPHHPTWTWTPCLMSLERQIMMLCSDIRSAVVKSTVYLVLRQVILLVLSYLSLMFRPMMIETRPTCEKSISLLDLDEVSSSSSSSNVIMSSAVDDQLKDLLTFGGGLISPVNANELVEHKEETESTDVSSGKPEKIDGMILANLANFEEEATQVCSPGSTQPSSGLVKRR